MISWYSRLRVPALRVTGRPLPGTLSAFPSLFIVPPGAISSGCFVCLCREKEGSASVLDELGGEVRPWSWQVGGLMMMGAVAGERDLLGWKR